MQNYEPDLKAAFNATSLIGYGTSVSVIVYGLIAHFLLSRYPPAEPAPANATLLLRWIGGAGVLLFLGMAGLRPLVLRINRPRRITSSALIRQLQTTAMIIFGGCETISIFGLVAAIVTREMQNYYWLAFLSLTAFWTYFPKYGVWDKHMQDGLFHGGGDIEEGWPPEHSGD